MARRWRRRWGAVAVAVVAAAFALAACGDGGSGSGPRSGSATTTAASTNAIAISNFMFSPMSASVAPGSTVRVTNKDPVTHTVRATDGAFNTGDIGPGQTKTFTAPAKAGTYGYICDIHQYMKGTIVVR